MRSLRSLRPSGSGCTQVWCSCSNLLQKGSTCYIVTCWIKLSTLVRDQQWWWVKHSEAAATEQKVEYSGNGPPHLIPFADDFQKDTVPVSLFSYCVRFPIWAFRYFVSNVCPSSVAQARVTRRGASQAPRMKQLWLWRPPWRPPHAEQRHDFGRGRDAIPHRSLEVGASSLHVGHHLVPLLHLCLSALHPATTAGCGARPGEWSHQGLWAYGDAGGEWHHCHALHLLCPSHVHKPWDDPCWRQELGLSSWGLVELLAESTQLHQREEEEWREAILQVVQQIQAWPDSPVQDLQAMHPEDGSPLSMDVQLRRLLQLQVFLPSPSLQFDHSSLYHYHHGRDGAESYRHPKSFFDAVHHFLRWDLGSRGASFSSLRPWQLCWPSLSPLASPTTLICWPMPWATLSSGSRMIPSQMPNPKQLRGCMTSVCTTISRPLWANNLCSGYFLWILLVAMVSTSQPMMTSLAISPMKIWRWQRPLWGRRRASRDKSDRSVGFAAQLAKKMRSVRWGSSCLTFLARLHRASWLMRKKDLASLQEPGWERSSYLTSDIFGLFAIKKNRAA